MEQERDASKVTEPSGEPPDKDLAYDPEMTVWRPPRRVLWVVIGANLFLACVVTWPSLARPADLSPLQRTFNGLFVAACNRVGFEPDRSGNGRDAEFWGHSLVAGPQGEILDEAGTEEEVLVVELDRRRSESVRRIWPFLRDRRIDAYEGLVQRFRD